MPILNPVPTDSLMRSSSGATYHHWLLACDRWLASKTYNTIMGTYALSVSDWQWKAAYDMDMLPSEAVCLALAQLSGEGGGVA